MSVGRDNRKKGGRRIIFADRSENSRFKTWLYILFFTDFSSRFTRRLPGGFTRRTSGGPARRPSGGLVRRYFYPPSFGRGVLGKSGCCEEEWTPIIIRDADKAPHFLPQETLSNFCTNRPLHKSF